MRKRSLPFAQKFFFGRGARGSFFVILDKFGKELGISQKKLEELSGVRQPVIARMEKGTTSPQLDTVLKVLAPLGKTLAVVPIRTK